MHRTIVSPALISCFLLVGACAPETQSAAQWDGSVRDSAGIEIVENFGQPLWEPGEEWRLVPDVRIGMREGPPEYQFGRIAYFGVLSDGRIVVTDQMVAGVRYYSPEGEHLYSVGKGGNGPREFGEGYLRPLRAYGDTVLVADYPNQQAHRLAPDGTWLASFSFRPEDGWRVWGWDSTPSGLIVNGFTPLQQPDTPLADTMNVIVVRNLDGTLGDTVGRVPMSQSFRFAGDVPERRYYAGTPDFDLRWDGGLVTGRSDRYELTWTRSGGEVERIVRLHREPLPFTDAEQATVMESWEERWRDRNLPADRIRQIKATLRFEDSYPYFRGFMMGPQGTLWLRRVRPIRDLTAEEIESLGFASRLLPASSFDVFDGRGRYLGIVECPPEMSLGQLFDDRMLGIVTDEFDVQYVQVLRIEGMDENVAASN